MWVMIGKVGGRGLGLGVSCWGWGCTVGVRVRGGEGLVGDGGGSCVGCDGGAGWCSGVAWSLMC